jgi:hypothetical protein
MSNKIVTTKNDGIRALESTPEIDDSGNLFVGATDTASAKNITCHTLNYENLNPVPKGEGVKWIETGGGNQTNSGEHAVTFYDAQTHSAMETFPSPTSVASQPLFSGTANDNKITLGINSKAFRNGSGTTSVTRAAPTKIDSNFTENSTALHGNYYLPACNPLNSPLPDIVNNMKWLSIQDNTGNTFYIPAYYNDLTIVEPANILINGSTENQNGIVYEDGRDGPVVFNISTSYPPIQSTTIDIIGSRTDVSVSNSFGNAISSLTFTPANYNIGQTIRFEAVDDLIQELTETITFTLRGSTASHWNGGLPNENKISITVIDDDNDIIFPN